MVKVPLIPFQRPVPQVFLKKEPTGTKPPKRKPSMVATKSTKPKSKFTAHNVEDITQKPVAVQKLWKLLSDLDPNGELFVNDKGLVVIDGDGPKDRTLKALKLKPEQAALITPYAIYDSPDEPDNAESANGVIFTMYQFVELAYALGAQDEAARVTKAMASASEEEEEQDLDDEEEGDGEAETFDDEEMEEVNDDDEEDDDDDEDEDDEDDDEE